MPIIITPEPPRIPLDKPPLYSLRSEYVYDIVFLDYSNAVIMPAMDTYYNSHTDITDYTINLFIPVKVGHDIEDSSLKVLKDSHIIVQIQVTNYQLAIHIFNQLLAGKNITPDSLRDELPEIFL